MAGPPKYARGGHMTKWPRLFQWKHYRRGTDGETISILYVLGIRCRMVFSRL